MAVRKLTEFGKQVKIGLIKNDMTQKELCEELNITEMYLTDILYGSKTGYSLRPKIAGILNFDYKDTRKTR